MLRKLFYYIFGSFTIKAQRRVVHKIFKKYAICISVVRWETKIRTAHRINCALVARETCEIG